MQVEIISDYFDRKHSLKLCTIIKERYLIYRTFYLIACCKAYFVLGEII